MSVQTRAVEEGPLKDTLWAHFTSIFRKGYLWAEDSLMPQFYGRFAKCIKDFQVRPEDTWVASFPKCGTASLHFDINQFFNNYTLLIKICWDFMRCRKIKSSKFELKLQVYFFKSKYRNFFIESDFLLDKPSQTIDMLKIYAPSATV